LNAINLASSDRPIPILIVGSGIRSLDMIKLLDSESRIRIVGIVTADETACSVTAAKVRNINIYGDIKRAILMAGTGCLIFNMTGDEAFSDVIAGLVGPGGVIGGRESSLFWLMFSDLKHAKREAIEKEKRLNSIVLKMKEGLLVVNEDGAIDSLNPAAQDMFRLSELDSIGTNVFDLLSFPDIQSDVLSCDFIVSHLSGSTECTGVSGETSFPADVSIIELPMDSGRLYTIIVRDISIQKEAEDKLKKLALYDHLTGLPNRTLFYESCDSILFQSERLGTTFAVLFIDLDGFKGINDTLGHDAGDNLLCQVGKRIQKRIRKSDRAARLGGDEFVAILANIDDGLAAESIASSIVESLGEPFKLDGIKCMIGASVGVSVYPDNGRTSDHLLQSADTAMYAAKNTGKNKVVMAKSRQGIKGLLFQAN